MRAPLVAIALLAAVPARANDLYGYYDLSVVDVVGEIGTKTYDRSVKAGDGSRFVGVEQVKGGVYGGGGFGLGVQVVAAHGFLFGANAQVSGGRITGANLPWGSTSTALHYAVVTDAGYALSLGHFAMIHGAAVLGFDGMRFDVADPTSPIALALAGSSISPSSFTLSRFDLRLGALLAVHVNFAKLAAVYASAELDYDGQYRVQAGLSFGAPYNARW
jgi:hypothetical protein